MSEKSKNTNARRRQWADRALAGDALALDPIFRTVLGVLERHVYHAGQIGEPQIERVAADMLQELRLIPGMDAVPRNSPNRAQRDALRKAEDETA